MDSLNSNLYATNSNKDDIFGGYVRNPCAQQTERHFLPPYAMPMSNNVSQPLIYNSQNQPMYNIMYTHQSMYRNQNTFPSFTQESWQDPCLKTTDYKTEKYENRNDSCCLKTKNFYNYNKNSLLDPNWYYSNYESSKYTELPSCSQIGSNNCCDIEKRAKSVKYCSIQKLPEVDSKLIHSSKSYDSYKDYSSCSQFAQSYSNYSSSTCLETDKKTIVNPYIPNDIINGQYFPTQNEFIDVSNSKPIDKNEDNGNESDIIVENSEEESEESDLEKEVMCLVCKAQIEKISFDITLEKTVTSFTRTKVSEKLFQILGWIPIENRSKLICNVCMSLLNNLDSLEKQLSSIKQKILTKYKRNDLPPNKSDLLTINKQKTVKKQNYCFKCPLCKKVYSFEKFYYYHLARHKAKKYFCHFCRIKFNTLTQLKFHCKKHKTKIENSTAVKKKQQNADYVCSYCGRKFKSLPNLKEHENLCSGNLPFECTLCKKSFPSLTKMKQHLKSIHEKDFKIICKLCKKGFIKNCDYKKHMLSHSKEKNYKCSICGNLYKTLSNLNQHKKLHEKTFPFNCDICNKGFLRREKFESHLNNHNGNKPFTCNFCSKTFTMQKYLNTHLKIHDGTIKMKTCNICGKQIKNNLEEHVRLHSNVKNFECVKCLMKFLTKGALAKHKKRKHEIQVVDVL